MTRSLNARRLAGAAGLALTVAGGPAAALDVLVANDDGHDAGGLRSVERRLSSAGHDVLVVAPCGNRSGSGGKLNTRFGRSTGYRETGERRYCVEGSPVDAVLMGLHILGPELGVFGEDDRPDLVISGINRGPNVGILTNHSGTVGAAVRAIREGVPAIAVSAGLDPGERESGFPSTTAAYDGAAALIVKMVERLDGSGGSRVLPAGLGLNVNWPVALPAGVDRPRGIRWTRITNSTPFNLVPVRRDDGSIVIGHEPIGEVGEVDVPNAEGKLYGKGYVTISPMDGNLGSVSETGEVRGRLESLALP